MSDTDTSRAEPPLRPRNLLELHSYTIQRPI